MLTTSFISNHLNCPSNRVWHYIWSSQTQLRHPQSFHHFHHPPPTQLLHLRKVFIVCVKLKVRVCRYWNLFLVAVDCCSWCWTCFSSMLTTGFISNHLNYPSNLWETAPPARFYRMLGQTHVNGWSHVITSQNGGSTDYIFPLRLGVHNRVVTYLIIGKIRKP